MGLVAFLLVTFLAALPASATTTQQGAGFPGQPHCSAVELLHSRGHTGCAQAGTVVPLYMYPGTTWTTLEQTARRYPSVPVIAIVNPDSGPGSAYDPNYTTGIAGLLASGITPVGYVWTNYGNQPMADAEAAIAAYHQWYPHLKGIFLDGMAAATGSEAYYATLTAYARREGFAFTVGNPGVTPAPSYVGTVNLINVYEDGALPTVSSLAQGLPAHDRTQYSMLAYDIATPSSSFVAQAEHRVGWIYLTNDTLPNPWDTLPPYFPQLLHWLATSSQTR